MGRSSPRELIPALLSGFFANHPNLFKKEDSILAACSGGPDSVALILGLKHASVPFPTSFIIGHVNHKLRGRFSDQDAAFVKQLAKKVGWPCQIVEARVDKENPGNIEEKARVQRYKALISLARRRQCRFIFTGHTMDDSLETVLLNMSRGAGPDGLSGLWPVRRLASDLDLCRPLLEATKNQTLDYLRERNEPFRTDQSNSDAKFSRNWIRSELLPLWRSRYPELPRRLLSLSRIMRDEQSFWDQVVRSAWIDSVKPHKAGFLIDMRRLLIYSPAVQRRLLRRVAGPDLLTFAVVEDLRSWMTAPPTGGRTFQLKKGWTVRRFSKSEGFSSARLFWFCQSKPLSSETLNSDKP